MNPNLKDLLEFEEGRKRRPYLCSEDHWTVGVGHKMTDTEIKILGLGGDFPEFVIDRYLEEDMLEATNSAKKYPWFSKLNDARQAVIISMIFQMGAVGFAKFQNTIKLIAKGQYEAAAENMLRSIWAKQTPNRAKRHAEQFKTGVWCKEYKKLAA